MSCRSVNVLPEQLKTQDGEAGQDGASEASKQQKMGSADIGRAPYFVSFYHSVILVFVIFIALRLQYRSLPADEWFDEIYALLGGAMGGTVTASRWVVWAVRHGEYDRRRLLWQMLTPVYSAALAWIGLLAIRGGLLVLSNSTSTKEPNFTYFVLSFSFLVGFASEAFLKRLILAAQTLFGEHREERREADLDPKKNESESKQPKESD